MSARQRGSSLRLKYSFHISDGPFPLPIVADELLPEIPYYIVPVSSLSREDPRGMCAALSLTCRLFVFICDSSTI
jgi:hypothetical protein